MPEEIVLKPGQVWKRDGLERWIVRLQDTEGTELEVPSVLIRDGVASDRYKVYWRRVEKKRIFVCWCSTWESWMSKAKLTGRILNVDAPST